MEDKNVDGVDVTTTDVVIVKNFSNQLFMNTAKQITYTGKALEIN